MTDPRRTRSYFDPAVLSRIGRLELRARHVVEGFVSGMHASAFKGFSVEFADHREYAPGDDLRHIDWRVYAKSDRFYVKEYEVETNLRARLLLDCSGSMAYPEHGSAERMSKWDYAATVVVSLAHLLVAEQSDAAGVVLFDDRVRTELPVSASRAALAGLAQTIEGYAPAGRTDVRLPFAELAERIGRRGMVIVVSDLLTDVQQVLDGLGRFQAAGHDVLVLQVLDQDEIEFPFSDRTLFEGLEEPGLEVLTDPQSLRTSYRQAVQDFVRQVRDLCLNRQIDYALLSTADPLDTALTSFLAGRMHRFVRGQ